MTNIDQFESVFKAAERVLFNHEAVRLGRVLTITDMNLEESQAYEARIRSFLQSMDADGSIEWLLLSREDFTQVDQMVQRVQEHRPDLVCVYRNLYIPAGNHPYSLGVYVDVLTQATKIPVLALPHPALVAQRPQIMQRTTSVMAVTDHLSGDHHLVSYAAYFTPPQGKLLLTHVEDQATFERYMDIIAKVPSVDTETARHDILERLLKEPRDYIESCREVLRAEDVDLQIESIITLGRRLDDYRQLIREHEVSLMVMHTKDEDQLAMHGLAYPLTVELRDLPQLLL